MPEIQLTDGKKIKFNQSIDGFHYEQFSDAMDETHGYLMVMGAKVSAIKSFNFAINDEAMRWLRDITWPKLKDKIQVTTSFKYLGAQVNAAKNFSQLVITA